ncbi:hypothetical protein [Actinoplanes sp. M2I2]|uniref:hypothetical protein n=1 Tax=Actinoplanes sp. M2I2 TaxID=1734444 RepID=UPI0020205BB3|nr:hypothetical protein [Actinoplanes sp. M2I2]
MPWSTSTDVREFLVAAGDFLREDPVGNTLLLSEAAYLEARPTPRNQLYGWWTDVSGAVTAAFLQAPDHSPVLSPVREDVASREASAGSVASDGIPAEDAGSLGVSPEDAGSLGVSAESAGSRGVSAETAGSRGVVAEGAGSRGASVEDASRSAAGLRRVVPGDTVDGRIDGGGKTASGEALWGLAGLLPGVTRLSVDARNAGDVVAAWRGCSGVTLTERSRVTLCRLAAPRLPAPSSGRARRAGPGDRELLVGWFHELMAAKPDDASDLAYVIDDPLDYGGITVWEVDGVPVAMAGRSRVVAGMTRVGATYAPGGDRYGQAVFAAACAEAVGVARHVVLLTTDVAGHAALGFAPVGELVTLEVPARTDLG